MLLYTKELKPKRPNGLERNAKIQNIKIKKMKVFLMTDYNNKIYSKDSPEVSRITKVYVSVFSFEVLCNWKILITFNINIPHQRLGWRTEGKIF
jgi:hypothetical protein